METVQVFAAGVRNENGVYCEFISSRERRAVDEYIEIMKGVLDQNFEIVFHEKTYGLVSTVPQIINRNKEVSNG